MPASVIDRQAEWAKLLSAAREGNDEALGQICEQIRQYLMLIVAGDLGSDLRAKVGASDVVQETMLEACDGLGQFRGTSEEEFRAWIRRLAQHNLVDSARRYRQTQRRDTSRETSIEADETSHGQIAHSETASRIVRRRERDEELARAVARLPENRRRLVELRHREGLSYFEIAREMGISEVAARKLWSRTVRALQQELVVEDEPRSSQPR